MANEQAVTANAVSRFMFGRRVIYTSEKVITQDNVAKVVEQAYITHLINRDEMKYLFDYYKGNQPVIHRFRELRDELTAHVVENRANEIVSFKVGYLAGKPIQYISSASDESVSDAVAKLNDMMRVAGKATKDRNLIENEMICGLGYRLILPNSNKNSKRPFSLYTLDPMNTFVIRANDYTKRVLCAVNYSVDVDTQDVEFSIYTDDSFFFLKKGTYKPEMFANPIGRIPIVEYQANSSRQGCFEIVLSMLDAINNFDSARMEAIEQFVQSLLVLYNCQLDEGTTAQDIRKAGMILLKSIGDNKADVKNLTEQLDQSQNQTLKSDLYQSVLQIVGVPAQSNGSTGDSSNNGAVILKNGWQGAETRAEDFEAMFKEPEQETLEIVSILCRGLSDVAFDPEDIDIKFTRRNYEDILSKSQTLTTMLGSDKIHPRCAYEASGLFADVEDAYQKGMEWYEQMQKKLEEVQAQNAQKAVTENVE